MLVSAAQLPDFDRVVSQVPGKVGMMRCKNSSSSKFTGVANGNTKTKLVGKRNYRNMSRHQIVIFEYRHFSRDWALLPQYPQVNPTSPGHLY